MRSDATAVYERLRAAIGPGRVIYLKGRHEIEAARRLQREGLAIAFNGWIRGRDSEPRLCDDGREEDCK